MAISTFQKRIVVVLELEKDEADWLRTALQNPLYETYPDNEDPQAKKHRESIFNALANPK